MHLVARTEYRASYRIHACNAEASRLGTSSRYVHGHGFTEVHTHALAAARVKMRSPRTLVATVALPQAVVCAWNRSRITTRCSDGEYRLGTSTPLMMYGTERRCV